MIGGEEIELILSKKMNVNLLYHLNKQRTNSKREWKL